MASFRGRSRSPYRGRPNGGRRHGYAGTRRSGKRSSKGRTIRRIGIGLGVVGAAALAVNAGILGAAGTSRAVKELAGTAKSIRKWSQKKAARKAVLKASTVAFHARRVSRIKVYKFKRIKPFKPSRVKKIGKVTARRFGKR